MPKARFSSRPTTIAAAPPAFSNGCVLLEAPTGAGKTFMAGLTAEVFARPDDPHNAKNEPCKPWSLDIVLSDSEPDATAYCWPNTRSTVRR